MGFSHRTLADSRRRQPERCADQAGRGRPHAASPGWPPRRRRLRFQPPPAERGSPSPPRRPAASRSRRGTGRSGQGFFATLGVPMRAGRAFSEADSSAGAHRDRQRNAGRDSSFRTAIPSARDSGSRTCRTTSSASSPTTPAARSTPAYPSRACSCRCAPDSKDVTRMTFLVRERRAIRRRSCRRFATRRARRGRDRRRQVSETVDQMIDIGSQEMLVGTAPLFPLVTIGMLLTTAGIYGVLAFAIARRSTRAGGARRGRRERPRCGPARHRAHAATDRGRIDARRCC